MLQQCWLLKKNNEDVLLEKYIILDFIFGMMNDETKMRVETVMNLANKRICYKLLY